MKLRSGHTCGTMNPHPQTIVNAVLKLNELYKIGEQLIAYPENADRMKGLLVEVNNVYDLFTSLCSHLTYSDVIPGNTVTKLDFDIGYWEFKQIVQEWFNSLKDTVVELKSPAQEPDSIQKSRANSEMPTVHPANTAKER